MWRSHFSGKYSITSTLISALIILLVFLYVWLLAPIKCDLLGFKTLVSMNILITLLFCWQEAVQCLNDHTQRIKLENRQLRHELLLLIRKTRALHEHRQHLEDQKKQLLLEQQYSQDLKTLRTARQHKVLKSFGMLDTGEEMEEGEEGMEGAA